MVEPATNPATTPLKPKPSRITKAWSLLYIEAWLRWYKFKVGRLASIIAGIIFLLSVIELLGPLAHLWPEGEPCGVPPAQSFWHAHGARLLIAGLLFLTASIMIYDHNRLHRRVERYEVFVAYLMWLEDKINSKTKHTIEDAILILDGLIKALEYGGEKKEPKEFLNAAVVKREVKGDSPFFIYAQDTRNAFKKEVPIPASDSAAGRLVKWEDEQKPPKVGVLLYVPVSRLFHGVALWSDQAGHHTSSFGLADVVEFSFNDLGNTTTQGILECIASVRIPLEQIDKPPDAPDQCAVLCLNGHKENALGHIDFTATKLAADILAKVMRKYEKIESPVTTG